MHLLIDMNVEEPYYSRFGTGNSVKPDYQKFCWMTKLYPYLYSTYGKAINVTIHVRDAETTDGMKRYFFKVEGITVKADKDSNAEKVLSEIKGQSNDLCLLYHPTFSDYPLPWVRDVLPLISYSRDVTYDADNGGVYVKLDEFLYQHQYTVMIKQIERQLRYAFIQGWIRTTDEKFIKNNFLILINDDVYRSFGRLYNTNEDMSTTLERRARGDNRVIFPYIFNERQRNYIISQSGIRFGEYLVMESENLLPIFRMDKIVTEAKLKYL